MAGLIDTLNIYERLKGADLKESAAKEIAEVFKEVTEGHLSTKEDLKITEAALKKEIELTEANLKKEIELTEANLREEISKAKVEIIKWVAGMLVAQAAIVATLVKLL